MTTKPWQSALYPRKARRTLSISILPSLVDEIDKKILRIAGMSRSRYIEMTLAKYIDEAETLDEITS